MHKTSLDNMRVCYDRFIKKSAVMKQASVQVFDVGGANLNGTYREIFDDPKVIYTSIDPSEGTGIEDLDDESADIIVCGQTLEHVAKFWDLFGEMRRVLKPTGIMIVIAPSAGPEHGIPIDCWRFMPDGFKFLADAYNCKVLYIKHDDRAPWYDLVGVFAKDGKP